LVYIRYTSFFLLLKPLDYLIYHQNCWKSPARQLLALLQLGPVTGQSLEHVVHRLYLIFIAGQFVADELEIPGIQSVGMHGGLGEQNTLVSAPLIKQAEIIHKSIYNLYLLLDNTAVIAFAKKQKGIGRDYVPEGSE